MSRSASPARIVMWKGQHHVFYTDANSGKQVRVRCEAVGATTAKQRTALLAEYREAAFSARVERLQRGTVAAFDTPLADDLAGYVAWLEERKAARLANPAAREGIAPKSCRLAGDSVRRFACWLPADLKTGELEAQAITRYLAHLSAGKFHRKEGERCRAGSTLNLERRNIKAALRWVNDLRPVRFRDFPLLAKALKPVRVDAPLPEAFNPAELQAFYTAAQERRRVMERVRFGKLEQYSQTVRQPATPTDRLFILLALTGLRLGEALSLTWDCVDLGRGRLTIHAQKTGRTRVLPLVGAREGDVAPGLLELLRDWREAAPDAVYVLPCKRRPVFIRKTWDAVATRVGVKLTPQSLRSNFVSYAAAVGVPASVCAMWCGHSAAVAEKFYRCQVLDGLPGSEISQQMGLLTRSGDVRPYARGACSARLQAI